MGNMGYVRFENTYEDLSDCYEHILDDDLSESEEEYRRRLVSLCRKIIDDYAG